MHKMNNNTYQTTACILGKRHVGLAYNAYVFNDDEFETPYFDVNEMLRIFADHHICTYVVLTDMVIYMYRGIMFLQPSRKIQNTTKVVYAIGLNHWIFVLKKK